MKRPIDGVLLATMAGMIGSLAKDAPNLALKALGIVGHTYWQLAASVLLPQRDASTPGGILVGAITDLILGGALGIIILAVYRVFGYDLWWYKGVVSGNFIWLFGAGLVLGILAGLKPFNIPFRVASLFDHQIFGLVTAYLIWRWSKPPKGQPGA